MSKSKITEILKTGAKLFGTASGVVVTKQTYDFVQDVTTPPNNSYSYAERERQRQEQQKAGMKDWLSGWRNF